MVDLSINWFIVHNLLGRKRETTHDGWDSSGLRE